MSPVRRSTRVRQKFCWRTPSHDFHRFECRPNRSPYMTNFGLYLQLPNLHAASHSAKLRLWKYSSGSVVYAVVHRDGSFYTKRRWRWSGDLLDQAITWRHTLSVLTNTSVSTYFQGFRRWRNLRPTTIIHPPFVLGPEISFRECCIQCCGHHASPASTDDRHLWIQSFPLKDLLQLAFRQ